jgi:hypothetical protein
MSGYTSLKNDVSLFISTSCAASNLGEELKRSFASAKIRNMESDITINNTYVRDVGEIVSLSNHLGADQDVHAASLDVLQHARQGALAAGAVAVDARDLQSNPTQRIGDQPISELTPATHRVPMLSIENTYNLDELREFGARVAKLEVKFSGGGDAGPARTYAKSDVAAWVKNAASVDGQALEITVALGSTGANVSSIPSSYKPDDYAGVVLYTASGDHERLLGFYKKGSSAQRFVEENDGQYNGSGTPPKVYTAKGVAYGLKGLPKSAFLIESIDAQDAAGSSSAGARPTGRDWFVRAGATGGDGSKDKPFKDPWQALEKVEAGDSVHVAEGEYFGKLKVGKWKVAMPYVALIGGYDKDFTERNPWKHPTRLFTPADFKGTRDGYGWGFPLQIVGDKARARDAARRMTVGDMPSFTVPMEMILDEMVKVRAGQKHAIVISDGDPSAPPPELLNDFKAAKVTVTTVLLAGYQAEGSLGRILQDGASMVTIMGEQIQVKAAIRQIDDYSGHADGPELVEWLRQRLPIAGTVFITHGEEQAQLALENDLKGAGVAGDCIIRPRLDDVYEISGEGCALLAGETKPRVDPGAMGKRDSNNELQAFLADIQEQLKDVSDREKAVILGRLRKALAADGRSGDRGKR